MLQDANLAKQNKWLLRNTINLLDGINKVAFPIAMVTDALQFGSTIKLISNKEQEEIIL